MKRRRDSVHFRRNVVIQDLTLRRAETQDLDAIVDLLCAEGLPTADVARHLDRYLVAAEGRTVIGAIGLESRPPCGLLRSLVVRPSHRGRRIAQALCERLFATAREQGLERLFLLTTDASGYFGKLGFVSIQRDLAPPEICDTEEFRELCPDSAALMIRDL